MQWTFYAYVDSYGDYCVEPGGQTNNVMALPTITNTNPLGESSWNIYRGVDGGAASLLTNITAPAWQPGCTPAATRRDARRAGSGRRGPAQAFPRSGPAGRGWGWFGHSPATSAQRRGAQPAQLGLQPERERPAAGESEGEPRRAAEEEELEEEESAVAGSGSKRWLFERLHTEPVTP